MPDSSRNGDSQSGDAESSAGLIGLIRGLLTPSDKEPSLREQLEDAIDEHEEDHADSVDAATNGDLSPVERQMLRNLLHFSEHDADDVAIPRGEIVAVSADATWTDLIASFSDNGHSRMPVYRDQLDHVIGMIHIKDVFPFLATKAKPPKDWTTLMRQPIYVPQSRGALDVLADMRARRVHLAIVVDEFSGTDGVITIEDLVEEIVGEIEDETDEDSDIFIRKVNDQDFVIKALTPIDDFNEYFKANLDDSEYETIGGLIMQSFGYMPKRNEITEIDGYTFRVVNADNRQLHLLRLSLEG